MKSNFITFFCLFYTFTTYSMKDLRENQNNKKREFDAISFESENQEKIKKGPAAIENQEREKETAELKPRELNYGEFDLTEIQRQLLEAAKQTNPLDCISLRNSILEIEQENSVNNKPQRYEIPALKYIEKLSILSLQNLLKKEIKKLIDTFRMLPSSYDPDYENSGFTEAVRLAKKCKKGKDFIDEFIYTYRDIFQEKNPKCFDYLISNDFKDFVIKYFTLLLVNYLRKQQPDQEILLEVLNLLQEKCTRAALGDRATDHKGLLITVILKLINKAQKLPGFHYPCASKKNKYLLQTAITKSQETFGMHQLAEFLINIKALDIMERNGVNVADAFNYKYVAQLDLGLFKLFLDKTQIKQKVLSDEDTLKVLLVNATPKNKTYIKELFHTNNQMIDF